VYSYSAKDEFALNDSHKRILQLETGSTFDGKPAVANLFKKDNLGMLQVPGLDSPRKDDFTGGGERGCRIVDILATHVFEMQFSGTHVVAVLSFLKLGE
jgi:hypothetical protein